MYSFVYVLMRLTSLTLKQHFFCILSMQTRLVTLISTQTKEYFFGRHLCIRSIQKKLNIYIKYLNIKKSSVRLVLHFSQFLNK